MYTSDIVSTDFVRLEASALIKGVCYTCDIPYMHAHSQWSMLRLWQWNTFDRVCVVDWFRRPLSKTHVNQPLSSHAQ